MKVHYFKILTFISMARYGSVYWLSLLFIWGIYSDKDSSCVSAVGRSVHRVSLSSDFSILDQLVVYLGDIWWQGQLLYVCCWQVCTQSVTLIRLQYIGSACCLFVGYMMTRTATVCLLLAGLYTECHSHQTSVYWLSLLFIWGTYGDKDSSCVSAVGRSVHRVSLSSDFSILDQLVVYLRDIWWQEQLLYVCCWQVCTQSVTLIRLLYIGSACCLFGRYMMTRTATVCLLLAGLYTECHSHQTSVYWLSLLFIWEIYDDKDSYCMSAVGRSVHRVSLSSDFSILDQLVVYLGDIWWQGQLLYVCCWQVCTQSVTLIRLQYIGSACCLFGGHVVTRTATVCLLLAGLYTECHSHQTSVYWISLLFICGIYDDKDSYCMSAVGRSVHRVSLSSDFSILDQLVVYLGDIWWQGQLLYVCCWQVCTQSVTLIRLQYIGSACCLFVGYMMTRTATVCLLLAGLYTECHSHQTSVYWISLLFIWEIYDDKDSYCMSAVGRSVHRVSLSSDFSILDQLVVYLWDIWWQGQLLYVCCWQVCTQSVTLIRLQYIRSACCLFGGHVVTRTATVCLLLAGLYTECHSHQTSVNIQCMVYYTILWDIHHITFWWTSIKPATYNKLEIKILS